MLYFLDTSALVKRYHQENGSHTIIQIFETEENRILISSLSLAEFVSAINRVKNRGEISEEDFKFTLDKFTVDISIGRIGIVDITRVHIFSSTELIIKYNLFPADAVILAVSLELQEYDPIFVCADIRSGLLKAAQACRLSTLNPLHS